MTKSESDSAKYELLEAILKQRGLPLQAIYTYADASRIMGASVRTIQEWRRDKKLLSRNLPGRGRFLSVDLEEFLRQSLKTSAVDGE